MKIGSEEIEAQFNAAFDAFLQGGQTPGPILLEGDWGSGKTHIKTLLRHEMRRRQIPHVATALGRYQGSLAHLHLTVPQWLTTVDFGGARGLRAALDAGILSPGGTHAWANTKVTPFAEGLRWALGGWDEAGWLRALGHCYAMPNQGYQHWKALDLVLSAGEYVATVGGRGIALLLDEAENVCLQHDIRGRRRSYDALRRLYLSQHFLLTLFVTARFLDQVQQDWRQGLASGWVYWTEEAREFVSNLRHMTRLKTPALRLSDAKELVRRIHAVYQEAYGPISFATSEADILRAWTRTPTHSVRLLIRLTVSDLDVAAGVTSTRTLNEESVA
ncbi:MAG TPA: P-loop NTPase fold protein [Myxococcaceae bacterium]|nr:P-loop NTPase fold protein [Myxococcaceae bacterium]